jgi:cation transport regulator ChaB
MPKMAKSGKPKKSELPSTLQRSPAKAQRTFAKAHDSAAEQYGEGKRAHQTAYAALKRCFEKTGDRWEPKEPCNASSKSGSAGNKSRNASGKSRNASKSRD